MKNFDHYPNYDQFPGTCYSYILVKKNQFQQQK
jgi:hypothetical protein